MAQLPGVRAAFWSELPPKDLFNSALLKRVTGGDTLSARALYKMPVNFVAAAFPIFAGNWMPGIEYHEKALWDRCLLLSFAGPVKDKDPGLPGRLREADAVDAILAEAVRGYLDLAAKGFQFRPPRSLRNAKQEHRADMDPLRAFFEEHFVAEEGAFVTAKMVYGCYANWAEVAEARRPMSQHQLARELKARGFGNKPKKRIGKEVVSLWWGLRRRD